MELSRVSGWKIDAIHYTAHTNSVERPGCAHCSTYFADASMWGLCSQICKLKHMAI